MRGIRTFAQVFQYLVDDQDWPLELPDQLEDRRSHCRHLRLGSGRVGHTCGAPQGLQAAAADASPDGESALGRVLLGIQRTEVAVHADPSLATGSGHQEARRRLRRAGRPGHSTDLLFVVITGTGDDVELHLLAFQGSDPQTAEFRSLAWRPAHAPSRHLQRLSEGVASLPGLADR